MDCLIKIYWKHKITGAHSCTAFIEPKMVQSMLDHLKGSGKVPTGYRTRSQTHKEIPLEYRQNHTNSNIINPDF